MSGRPVVGRPRTANSRPGDAVQDARPVETTLGGDSDSDNEAAELRQFWQNIKRIQSLQGPSVQPVANCLDGIPVRPPLPEASVKVPRKESRVRPASSLSVAEMLSRELLSPKSPSRSTRSWAAPRRQHRVSGASLWRLMSADASWHVLCFLVATCISQVASACSATRESCCHLSPGGGWRLIVPHLSLCSKSCSTRLEQIWLPRAVWLDARSLNAKAFREFAAALEHPAAELAVRGLVSLDLRGARMASALAVSAAVSACGGLQMLDLSQTRLRDDGLVHVAQGLLFDETGRRRPHPSLRKLVLEGCGLTDVSGPALAEVALSVRLETLLLTQNALGDSGAEALAGALGLSASSCFPDAGSCLARLDLSVNGLAMSGMAALLRPLGGSGSVQPLALDIGGNEAIGSELTAAPAGVLAEALATLGAAVTLRELHLWRCGLADESFYALMAVQPPQLELLNLAANPLSAVLRGKLVRNYGRNAGIVRL